VRVEQTSYEVPSWGVGELWTADGVVLAHDFTFDSAAGGAVALAARAQPPMGVQSPPSGTVPPISPRMGDDPVSNLQQRPPGGRSVSPEELAERFVAFFGGDDVRFTDVALDLSWATPFQRAVADTLRALRRGEVVSYGELAALAGHPGAQRAVGTFCARNRFMLLLPCHRVVAADGIGAYGSAGVLVKHRLLALEGVTL
jgi:methylated-DNA-[protein]-cysteine S-methyltransferase